MVCVCLPHPGGPAAVAVLSGCEPCLPHSEEGSCPPPRESRAPLDGCSESGLPSCLVAALQARHPASVWARRGGSSFLLATESSLPHRVSSRVSWDLWLTAAPSDRAAVGGHGQVPAHLIFPLGDERPGAQWIGRIAGYVRLRNCPLVFQSHRQGGDPTGVLPVQPSSSAPRRPRWAGWPCSQASTLWPQWFFLPWVTTAFH